MEAASGAGRDPKVGKMSEREMIGEIQRRHRKELRAAVLDALVRNGWSLGPASRELGVRPSRLQQLIRTHGLQRDYDARADMRSSGRPLPMLRRFSL